MHCSLQLGEEHDRAKESSECLKHLTQQAVKFQKTMNEICKGEKNVSIPPIQVCISSSFFLFEAGDNSGGVRDYITSNSSYR